MDKLKNPKFQETWNKYFSNKMVRLCQGVRTGGNEQVKRMQVIYTFYVIKLEYNPKECLKNICYTSVVCEVRKEKKGPNHTQITICGTNVCYPGGFGTNTASQEIFNLMIISILS